MPDKIQQNIDDAYRFASRRFQTLADDRGVPSVELIDEMRNWGEIKTKLGKIASADAILNECEVKTESRSVRA